MAMEKMVALKRSILSTCVVLFILQITIFFLVQVLYFIPIGETYAFYPICLLLHALLFFVLILLRGKFLSLPEKNALSRVNLPNALTLFRLSSTAGLSFIIRLASRYEVWPVLVGYLFLVFITDLLDGMLARRLNQKTEIGGILDSTSDYVLLILISGAYLYYKILPIWFFIAVILRLTFQGIFVLILLLRHRRLLPEPTIWGKVAVFSIMSLYVLAPALRFGIPLLIEKTSFLHSHGILREMGNTVTAITEYLVAGILVVSLADKILWFLKKITLPSA